MAVILNSSRSRRLGAQFKLDTLPERLEALPRYARPLFLRMVGEVKSTETFKPKRRAYVEEGFDPPN